MHRFHYIKNLVYMVKFSLYGLILGEEFKTVLGLYLLEGGILTLTEKKVRGERSKQASS